MVLAPPRTHDNRATRSRSAKEQSTHFPTQSVCLVAGQYLEDHLCSRSGSCGTPLVRLPVAQAAGQGRHRQELMAKGHVALNCVRVDSNVAALVREHRYKRNCPQTFSPYPPVRFQGLLVAGRYLEDHLCSQSCVSTWFPAPPRTHENRATRSRSAKEQSTHLPLQYAFWTTFGPFLANVYNSIVSSHVGNQPVTVCKN